jgi:hypothetical protein
VTGVQTCALPISGCCTLGWSGASPGDLLCCRTAIGNREQVEQGRNSLSETDECDGAGL